MAAWKPKHCSCYVILIQYFFNIFWTINLYSLLITEHIMGAPHMKIRFNSISGVEGHRLALHWTRDGGATTDMLE